MGRDSEEGITEAETRNIADIMTAFKFIVNVCCYVHIHVINFLLPLPAQHTAYKGLTVAFNSMSTDIHVHVP